MPTQQKRWQTDLWLEGEESAPVVIYAESLECLKQAVKRWLVENQPYSFKNAPTNYPIPERMRHYFFSDGGKQIPVFSLHASDETQTLAEGWYVIEGAAIFPQPVRLDDFDDVIRHYIDEALIPKKGPEFKEISPNMGDNIRFGIASHPAIFGAMIGLFSSICYLAIPIKGGYEANFVLAHGSLGVVVVFSLIMAGLFALFGLIVSRSMCR